MPVYTEIVRLGLSAVSIAAAVIVSLSPLNAGYAPAAWGVVTVGAVSSLLIWLWRRRRALRFTFHVSRFISRVPHITLDLAILSQIASATTQAFVAINLPSPHLPLHNTPGIGALYLALAGALSFVAVGLALRHRDAGRCRAALLGAGLFGSTLYLRSFAVAEAGPVYGPVFALTLAAAFAQHATRSTQYAVRNTQHATHFTHTFWSILFLAAVGLAASFSPVPGQSLDYWLRLAVLVGLAAVLPLCIDTKSWQIAGWCVVVIAGVLPILLAVGKLFSLIPSFGLLPALAYRLHPTELGGANLLARSVLCVIPLALALLASSSAKRPDVSRVRHYVSRFMPYAFLAGSAFVMLYSQSWEGLFAWLAALGVYGALAYWDNIQGVWQRWSVFRAARWVLVLTAILLALALAAISMYMAPRLNVYSFNGRLTHWYGAALAWSDHPWIGSGPGNEAAYAPYAESMRLWVETQTTHDDPLFGISLQAGRSLRTHSHNLFLEIAAGAGTFGLVTFVGLLVTIFRKGLQIWRSSNGTPRLWVAACLAGIVGELAWGTLDVLWVTPPFFSFPVWALLGLLFASSSSNPPVAVKPVVHRIPLVISASLFVLAITIVLLPAVASSHYAAGFLAFQERRWADATRHLEQTTRLAPLNPQFHELLARSYLEQGEVERATSTYEHASVLKRGYSPYSSQLGWLAWLQGDIGQAVYYFQRAVEQDPGENWRDGLHADLGLAYAAQGRYAEAVSMLKETIELNPQMAAASWWQTAQLPGVTSKDEAQEGDFDIVLDPVYIRGPASELQKRILAHLGVSDVTARLFTPANPADSTISLNDVLDAVEADYRKAYINGSRSAPLLLAALVEAAREARLYSRAEQACQEFQSLQPESAYGFRELGVLYHKQGRLAEAQAMLEHAVAVSPRDFASRYHLALVYLNQGRLDDARHMLDTITRQSLVTLFHSRLFDPELYAAWVRFYQACGDTVQAIDAQRKLAMIRGTPTDYLALAALHRQLGQPQQEAEQCTRAADALLRTWPRPLASELWEIAICLVQSGEDEPQLAIHDSQSGIRNILLGHIYRAGGQLEQALVAYQIAADLRPDEGAPYYFLGETYRALERLKEAEAAYLRAAELDPLESLPLLALGRMQWSQGQHNAAIETFRAAVEITPGWGEAHIALGNALLAQGDHSGAREHYRLAQIVDGDRQQGVVYDFGAYLAEAQILSPGPDYVRNDYFTIAGERRRVLFAHPDSRIGYTVDVAEGAVLAFDVALAPECWLLPGDGVAFAVYVTSEQSTQQVFSTYIDPKHNKADRRWHPHTVDLSAYAGQTVTLVFETSTGPAGDYRYDWAGWGQPRLLEP